MLVSFERSRSTRRTATVTISAPEASMARRIVALSGYLPVPTIRRDWNVRPPIVSGVSCIVASSPSHEVHQPRRVAGGAPAGPQRPPAHDLAVVLDDHGARVERQLGQQLEQGHARRHGPGLPVDDDVDGVIHCSSSNIRRATSPASAASHRARIAAAPYAPAAFTSRARPGPIPPIAITGNPSFAICASVSSPSGGRSGWVAVG